LSVFRHSWPKFEGHELVRSTGQRMPIGWLVFFAFAALLSRPFRRLAMTASVIPREASSSRVAVES